MEQSFCSVKKASTPTNFVDETGSLWAVWLQTKVLEFPMNLFVEATSIQCVIWVCVPVAATLQFLFENSFEDNKEETKHPYIREKYLIDLLRNGHGHGHHSLFLFCYVDLHCSTGHKLVMLLCRVSPNETMKCVRL